MADCDAMLAGGELEGGAVNTQVGGEADVGSETKAGGSSLLGSDADGRAARQLILLCRLPRGAMAAAAAAEIGGEARMPVTVAKQILAWKLSGLGGWN